MECIPGLRNWNVFVILSSSFFLWQAVWWIGLLDCVNGINWYCYFNPVWSLLYKIIPVSSLKDKMSIVCNKKVINQYRKQFW